MRNSRLVAALILACAVITPLTLTQFASSQSFTSVTVVQQFTSTAVTSVTSSVTSTVATPQNVRYNLTPDDFNNETGTFTLGYSEMGTTGLYYPEGGDYLCLMYDYFLLNATTAHEFKIHFDTQQGIPVNFLILNADQFNQFNHTNCAYGSFGWELHVAGPVSDQDWVVPQSGEYVFLFLSRAFYNGHIHLSVQAYGQAIETSTSAYTTTSTLVFLSTQIMTSTLPSVTPSTGNSALIASAIIIALVLIGGAVILRMKHHTKS